MPHKRVSQRTLATQDYPAALALWQACFGDDEAYVRLVWQHALQWGQGWGVAEQGALAAMLFALPGVLVWQTTRLPAWYIFAVCTAPTHRRRGYAAALLQQAEDRARQAGVGALCLCPAEASLYQYYAQQGFCPAFARQAFGACPPGLAPEPAFHAEAYARQRNATWGALGYFAWPPATLNRMAQLHTQEGGVVLRGGYWLCSNGQLAEAPVCNPTKAPGGMLKPLGAAAQHWLTQSAGQAYLGFAME